LTDATLPFPSGTGQLALSGASPRRNTKEIQIQTAALELVNISSRHCKHGDALPNGIIERAVSATSEK